MANEKPVYLSFLLRLWRADSQKSVERGPGVVWRASLENPHTHEQRGFASLEDLFEFLRLQTGLAASKTVSHPARTNPEARWSQPTSETSCRPLSSDRRFSG